MIPATLVVRGEAYPGRIIWVSADGNQAVFRRDRVVPVEGSQLAQLCVPDGSMPEYVCEFRDGRYWVAGGHIVLPMEAS